MMMIKMINEKWKKGSLAVNLSLIFRHFLLGVLSIGFLFVLVLTRKQIVLRIYEEATSMQSDTTFHPWYKTIKSTGNFLLCFWNIMKIRNLYIEIQKYGILWIKYYKVPCSFSLTQIYFRFTWKRRGPTRD